MGATEEQMRLLSDANITHVSYILILYSVAFLLYLFVNILLYVFATHAWPEDETNGTSGGRDERSQSEHVRKQSTMSATGMARGMNGSASGVNGSARLPKQRTTDDQQVRDAEEFELEGLMSEGEEDESPKAEPKKQGVIALGV